MKVIKELETGQNQTLRSEYGISIEDLYSLKVQSFITFLVESGLIKNARQIREIDSVTISCSLKNGLDIVGKMNFINCF